MKPGRNDPCPCGSGKKYKHCCLVAANISESAPADLVWRRLRALLPDFGLSMFNFVTKVYGRHVLGDAWRDFSGEEVAEFDPDPVRMQLFMPWFYYFWMPDTSGTKVADNSLSEQTPAEVYLEAHGRRLDPLLRRYVESLRAAPMTFFEVLAAQPGQGMRLRDILTREEYSVSERSASKVVEPGDILFGMLATLDQLNMLEASGGLVISPMEKARIVELRARIAAECTHITREVLREHDLDLIDLFHEIEERMRNPKMPELQNTDGEPLAPHKVMFDLMVTPQAAFDALKHLTFDESRDELLSDAVYDSAGKLSQVCIVWRKAGNKMHADWDNTVLGRLFINGARLYAEVNSKERAVAARELIEKHLGGGVRYRVTEIQSMEKMLAEARESGGKPASADAQESARLAERPEVREKIKEMMAAHWERWVDQPIPMLGDRTPMDAVKDADGREIVESILIQAERQGQIMKPATDAAVFRRLRERLGFAKS